MSQLVIVPTRKLSPRQCPSGHENDEPLHIPQGSDDGSNGADDKDHCHAVRENGFPAQTETERRVSANKFHEPFPPAVVVQSTDCCSLPWVSTNGKESSSFLKHGHAHLLCLMESRLLLRQSVAGSRGREPDGVSPGVVPQQLSRHLGELSCLPGHFSGAPGRLQRHAALFFGDQPV
eukprot:746617-Hanusia_phi.AAC.2